VGKYGKARVAGGIHGDDTVAGEENIDEKHSDIYKRFRLSEGVDVEKSVDTTGHRIWKKNIFFVFNKISVRNKQK